MLLPLLQNNLLSGGANPFTNTTTPGARIITVSADDREIIVPRDERSIIVPFDDRDITIPQR